MLSISNKEDNKVGIITYSGANNWEFTISKDKYFTSDEVLDAYLYGKEEGLKDFKRLLVTQLSENIERAGTYTSEILQIIKHNNFNPQNAFLKVENWNSFKILIPVPEKEFLSPEFLNIYTLVNEYEQKTNTDLFRIEVSFTDTTGLDINCIKSDGYIFKFKIAV